ncbi:BRE1-domain-containing protein [Pterulicium gracile]|uniref:E3 ubiquitin protein ligase n=1 Tax=Pterulicium gracile TaxID=1884261 RepID=A0A5C3QM53_9AGAR|nr:BRE1-domain-containing protein [Pterula gracilis]
MASVTPRKRSRSIEPDTVAHKKPNLAAEPSPMNGVVSESRGNDEPNAHSTLEVFRKEAIYRRMRHYARENERQDSRIAELERRKTTCEAGLAAMSACWAQLLQTVRVLTKADELPTTSPKLTTALDMASHLSEPDDQPALVQGLQDGMEATAALVSRLIQDRGGFDARDQLLMECQSAQSENITLRTQMSALENQTKEAEARADRFHEKLLSAEARLDRLQSQSLSMAHSSPKANAPSGSDAAPSPVQRESLTKPPPPSQQANGPTPGAFITDPQDAKCLEKFHQLYEDRLKRLESEADKYRSASVKARVDFKDKLSTELIKSSGHFQRLARHCAKLMTTNVEYEQKIRAIEEELSVIKQSEQELKRVLQEEATHKQKCLEMETVLAKREVENDRLREQRDRAIAELNERKARDSVKLTSIQEFKARCDSQADRIRLLNMEIARLRARLAADTNNQDALELFLSQSAGQNLDVSYQEDMQRRLRESEERANALEKTLANLEHDDPTVGARLRAEYQAQQELARTQEQLAKYQSVYGESSAPPPDITQLSSELQEKTSTISRLRLQVSEREQSESGLYSELEKLSSAWEALDKQLKSKADNLHALEERARQSQQDRAKAENKYFAVMKEKEAALSETKNALRNIEKQSKLLDKCNALREAAEHRRVQLEKEHEQHVLNELKLKHDMNELHGRLMSVQAKADGRDRQFDGMFEPFDKIMKQMQHEHGVLLQQTLEATKVKSDLEKQKASQPVNASPDKALQDVQTEKDNLNRLLKCSTCHQQYRKMIITKCMHTFCKPCIDSRVASRQRKCPHCNLQFSQSDVHQFYFQ